MHTQCNIDDHIVLYRMLFTLGLNVCTWVLIHVSVCQVLVDARDGGQIVAELSAEDPTKIDRNTQVQYMFLQRMLLRVQNSLRDHANIYVLIFPSWITTLSVNVMPRFVRLVSFPFDVRFLSIC
jgi:hypothetical protein